MRKLVLLKSLTLLSLTLLLLTTVLIRNKSGNQRPAVNSTLIQEEEVLIKAEEPEEDIEIKLVSLPQVNKEIENTRFLSDVNRGRERKEVGEYTVTTYDLSYDSCGKLPTDPYYGITSNGYDLRDLSREQAKTVATDPTVIPTGSKLLIEFEGEYRKFNGIYTARDVGGAIKGKKIDLFMGDFNQVETHQAVWDFGVRKAKVTILK